MSKYDGKLKSLDSRLPKGFRSDCTPIDFDGTKKRGGGSRRKGRKPQKPVGNLWTASYRET